MLIEEIIEGATQIFGRSGNKIVRKYRCTSGSRRGRIVAKPSTCTAAKNIKSYVAMKKTRKSKGSAMSIKSSRTKRSSPSSKRLRNLNVGSRRLTPKRRISRKRK